VNNQGSGNTPLIFLKLENEVIMAEDKKNPKDSKNLTFGEARLKHIEESKKKQNK
jgi:hypothetical protein